MCSDIPQYVFGHVVDNFRTYLDQYEVKRVKSGQTLLIIEEPYCA